jgi:hypothetical protein
LRRLEGDGVDVWFVAVELDESLRSEAFFEEGHGEGASWSDGIWEAAAALGDFVPIFIDAEEEIEIGQFTFDLDVSGEGWCGGGHFVVPAETDGVFAGAGCGDEFTEDDACGGGVCECFGEAFGCEGVVACEADEGEGFGVFACAAFEVCEDFSVGAAGVVEAGSDENSCSEEFAERGRHGDIAFGEGIESDVELLGSFHDFEPEGEEVAIGHRFVASDELGYGSGFADGSHPSGGGGAVFEGRFAEAAGSAFDDDGLGSWS